MTDSNNRNENNNHETINHEKDAKCITAALAFLMLGCFFKFILIGYQTIALILWGIGVLILLFGYLPYKWMKRLVAGCTILFVMGLCIIEIPIVSAAKEDIPNDADYLIVLGAGVNGTEPSLSLYNRLAASENWLREHPNSVAVLSGGQGQNEQISEAECMYRWLVNQGIDASRIFKEEKSTSTEENIVFSKAVINTLIRSATLF